MENITKYKCRHCCLIIRGDLLNDGNCPMCGSKAVKMCEQDHFCKCFDPVNAGIYTCPVCGAPTCPCGCHDVSIVSRVTGYLSDVGGWNEAKKAELRDRHRVTNGELFA